ncbi:MAG: serine/threonine protein kinase [Planctomycetota bacterium]|jgi:serine/threonine protein kinase
MDQQPEPARSELTHNDIPIAPDLVRNQFLHELLDDLAVGNKRPIEEYESRFPGYERLVNAEFERVGRPGDSDRTDVVNAIHSAATKLGQGDRVGRYLIQAPLAEGGMGIVYLATDEVLGRDVVLKTALPQMAGHADVVKRLRREAELAGRLDHPALCPVLDVVIDKSTGSLFIIQPFVAGQTLEVLHAKPTTPKGSLFFDFGGEESTLAHQSEKPTATKSSKRSQAVESPQDLTNTWTALLESLARALAHAHDKNVIHRDLKPNNIMIRPDGEPMILDFGLAREIGGEAHTEEGSTFGTPSYMAPEQVEGRIDEMGPRTDIYALGVILYKLLTGLAPYRGNTREALYHAILKGQPASLRSLKPSVSKDLEAVCFKAMERQPQDRFNTAIEFADELGRIQRGEPTLTRPLNPVGRLQRFAKRYPWGSGLAVAAVFMAVLLSVVFDQRQGAGETAKVAQFYVAYQDAMDTLNDEGRVKFSDKESAELLRLAEDNPNAQLLVEDPTDRKTMRRIRDAIKSGYRSNGRTKISMAWRPQSSTTDRRPDFVFEKPEEEGANSSELFVRLTRGSEDVVHETRDVLLTQELAPNSEDMLTMSMADNQDLVMGEYEWQVFRRMVKKSDDEPAENKAVSPVLRFQIRSQDELQAVTPTLPSSWSPNLGAYIEATALHQAGFQIAALASLNKVATDAPSSLRARALVLHYAIALALNDSAAANKARRAASDLAIAQEPAGADAEKK